jgi:hypothetical protein
VRVRSLKCPNCGAPAKILRGQQEGSCPRCGNKVRLSQAVLQEQARAKKFPSPTPLKLGMKAQLEGREYEVTGRQVLRVPDGEGGHSQWEEWLLIAGDGDLAYLEFDEGKWKISRPFVPQHPVGPDELHRMGTGSRISLDGVKAQVTDSGQATVVHVEGEFPWLVQEGKQVRYCDMGLGSRFYCVEWTEDEIEYYRGRFVDERQVYSMFGLRNALAALERRGKLLLSRKWFGGVCIAASIAGFLLWAIALGGGTPISSGRGTILANQAVGENGVRYGPIPLRAVGRVHRIEINGNMREQSVWLAAVLEDEDQSELISVDREMWDESGTDSDGYWHESDLHASGDFVLRKPGNYYLRLYAEPEPGRTLGSDVMASFTIKEKALAPLFPGLFAFAALAVGFISLIAGSPSTVAQLKAAAASDD